MANLLPDRTREGLSNARKEIRTKRISVKAHNRIIPEHRLPDYWRCVALWQRIESDINILAKASDRVGLSMQDANNARRAIEMLEDTFLSKAKSKRRAG